MIHYITFVATYWIVSFIAFMMEFYFNYKKATYIDRTELINTYIKVFPTVIFNLHILSFLMFFFGSPLLNIFNLEFSILKMIFDIVCSIIMIDFFLFMSHWIMHNKYLYKWSHKTHHELKNPIGFGAFYNHWFDFIFAVLLPAVYPPIILSSHSYTALIWTILATSNVVLMAHGGFDFDDKNHYYHHEKNNCNYGLGFYMDKLYDTELKN